MCDLFDYDVIIFGANADSNAVCQFAPVLRGVLFAREEAAFRVHSLNRSRIRNALNIVQVTDGFVLAQIPIVVELFSSCGKAGHVLLSFEGQPHA